jgi:hypothetical protein
VRDVCEKLENQPYQQVWKIIKKFGLVRLTDEQVIDDSGKDLKSVRKKIERSGNRVATADYNKLDAIRKIEHDTHLTIASAIQAGLSKKGIAAIPDRVKETNKQLEEEEAYLQWFTQSKFRNRVPDRHK